MTAPEDVASRLGRPLTDDEQQLSNTLRGDAERMIARRASGGITALDSAAVKQVVGAAVVRVLRNPDGYRSEGAGGVNYTIDTRAAAGFLTILADEWAMLGLGSRAGCIAPALGVPPASAYLGPLGCDTVWPGA